MVSVGLFAFTSDLQLRLVGRNLATNHTHEVMRISDQELLYNLHASACAFQLINFDGTNFTDSTPTPTTDQDALTQLYASTRANGVRFRQLAGGPYKFSSDTKATDTNLKFDFGAGGHLPYVPQVGDKVAMPLIAREFDITAVVKAPTTGNTTGTITISDSTGLGFTIDATTAGNVTTAYFYREVAYTVYNGQLRFHANYTGASKGNWRLIRDKITSPKPFALLFTSGSTEQRRAESAPLPGVLRHRLQRAQIHQWHRHPAGHRSHPRRPSRRLSLPPMRAKLRSPPPNQAGSGLLAVLFFMVLTSLTVAMIFSVTSSNVTSSRRTVDRAIAVTYADGVLENLFDQWRVAITNVSNDTDRTYGLSNTALATALTPPSSTTLPPPTGVTLSSWSVTALTPLLAPTTDPAGRPTLENGTSSRLRVRIYYRASVNVQFRGLGRQQYRQCPAPLRPRRTQSLRQLLLRHPAEH